jgi:fatty-acyl-CoA synthase
VPAYEFPLLIKSLLASPVSTRTPHEIVYRDQLRFTYDEFAARVGRLGSALDRLGVEYGDTVAVMDWDSHRYLESYFAVPMLGAVLQTVNVRLSPEQIAYCIDHADAKVLICNLDFLPLYNAIASELKKVEKVIWISEDGKLPDGLPGEGEYEAFIKWGDPKFTFGDFDENTRATIFYTTGTTGLPKGVTFTHRQLVLHTLALLPAFGLSREDVYMPMTPMFHVHAWGTPYAATTFGCTQVYPGRYAPDMLLKLLDTEKVTLSHCVPTVMNMVLGAPGSEKVDLSRMRVIIGGAAFPRALCEAALARGIDIFGGYGMSETCPILTIVRLYPESSGGEKEISYRTKAGKPVPLVELRIVDENMNDVPHDGVSSGEVVVRAPWLTQAYYKNPQATEELWTGGYLHTQDIGTIDEQGYLLITDRIKDVIKTGGEWVSSLALEDIIGRHPAVAEVAVIGVPDPKWSERPLAIVVLRPGATLEPDDIKREVLRHAELGVVSKFAVPESVLFVDAIEKTSVGKLDKKLLRKKYAPAPAPTLAPVS